MAQYTYPKNTNKKHKMYEKQNCNVAATQDGEWVNMHVCVRELSRKKVRGYCVTSGNPDYRDRNFRKVPGNYVISI